MKRLLLFIGVIILFSNIFAQKKSFKLYPEDIYISVKDVNIDKYLDKVNFSPFGVMDSSIQDTIMCLARIDLRNDTIKTILLFSWSHMKYYQYDARLNKITNNTNDSIPHLISSQINNIKYWYSKASKKKINDETIDDPYFKNGEIIVLRYKVIPLLLDNYKK